jgi:predicted DNA-binding transcriptional regulator YafY
MNTIPNNKILENIVKAAMENKTVAITYKDTKGVISERETEPYEIKNEKYWGYCSNKNSIRQFSLANILGARITENKYIPRWEVKIQ